MTSPTTYSFTGSVQTFTANATSTYDITAFGAEGGTGQGGYGGQGAEVSGDFNLVAGEQLSIVVGGQGGGSSYAGGGGGGSFVIETFNGTTGVRNVFLIAGGGGGADSNHGGGGDGQITAQGQDALLGHAGAGGINGGGGQGGLGNGFGNGTGGGGGYKGGDAGGYHVVGGDGFGYASAGGSYSGGAGYSGASGGFGGGGGAGKYGGGGGGGYSGGGGGGYGGGGGGGSINHTSFTNADKVLIAGQNSGDGSVTIDLVCYLRGTSILTTTGEVAVEDLKQDDMVVTRFGPLRPVRWIGRQSFNGRFIAAHRAPVRIHAGALGENVPRRDLFVSPAHSVLLNEHLVDAGLLVNGVTITQDATTDQIDYFHVDLGVSDCIVANGAWAESYAEQDNRDTFHNAAEFTALFPDHEVRYQSTCLPLVNHDRHEALPTCRAVTLGRAPPEHITDDADVHLIADGVRIEPATCEEGSWTFSVPTNARVVCLASHAASPGMMATSNDPRRLGVRVRSLTVRAGAASIALPLDLPLLNRGWHHAESNGQGLWRWTNGDAELPFASLAALVQSRDGVEVELVVTGNCLPRYLLSRVATVEPSSSPVPKPAGAEGRRPGLPARGRLKKRFPNVKPSIGLLSEAR